MKTNILLCILSLYLIIGCKQTSSIKDVNRKDTVTINNPIDTESYPELFGKYYEKFGIIIPAYYVVTDSLAIDLNNDKIMDRVLILSPISLEDPKKAEIEVEKAPKRMLLEVLSFDNYFKIRHSYADLVSDIGGVLSKYNGIYNTNDGFKIVHQSGSRYAWTYSVYFSVKDKSALVVDKIEKKCSFESKGEEITYQLNEVTPSSININDTIKANCNCDKIWETLDNDE